MNDEEYLNVLWEQFGIEIAVQERAGSSKPTDLIQQLEKVYASLAQGLNNPISDSEILGYIFEVGFSSAAKLTETSGQGVGLDVVKTVVNKLRGKIDLNSKPNEGTEFSMEFPLCAAIQNTLLVEVNKEVFAIPDLYVAEVIETPPEALQSIKDCKASPTNETQISSAQVVNQ